MQNQWQTALALLAACMTMGSIVLFIVVMHVTYQRKSILRESKFNEMLNENQILLLNTKLEAEGREKERIYRNMHDQINPMLRFVMRRLEMHRSELEKNTLTKDKLEEDIDLLLQAIKSMKASTVEAVPTFIVEFGLIGALKDVLSKLNSPGQFQTEFVNPEKPVKISFSEADQLNIYRIILELISNILRHTSCSTLELLIANKCENFSFLLKHNGKGKTNEQISEISNATSGHGLKSTSSRAKALGGRIDYQVNSDCSTVELLIPVLNG